MAAGSQLENGACALLVIAAKRIEIIIKVSSWEGHILRENQLLEVRVDAMAMSRKASPSRFVSAVIIPAPRDLGF
jgi:hypothetical protein